MANGSGESKNPEVADFAVIRWGLLIFVAFVVWQNLMAFFPTSLPQLEPFGFAAFLGTLGFVAARSTLRRDQQLKEIQNELEVARRIQLSILPSEFPFSTNFRVAARYVPMSSVAGDLYDYIIADDHQVGLLIADVSGHGVPAALIASMVKLAAASQRAVAGDPSRFFRHEFGSIGQHAEPIRYSSVCPPELRVWRTAILRCGSSASLARKEWTRDSN